MGGRSPNRFWGIPGPRQ